MFESTSHWNQLHEQSRFRPLYPNDNVVRFLMANRASSREMRRPRFLDIGTGAGRHTKLASELGLQAFGTDISFTGLRHAAQRLQQAGAQPLVSQASMLALPFADGSFRIVLSYGVFYYGTATEMKRAIAEVHRVLTSGGRALVVLRSTDDYRFGKGRQLERNTFQLDIQDTNEYQTTQHFLSAGDVPTYFAAFTHLSFDKTDATFANRTGVNSDWLITVEK